MSTKRFRILEVENDILPKYVRQSQSLEIKEGKLEWTPYWNDSKPIHVLGESRTQSRFIAQKKLGKYPFVRQ